MIAGLTAAAALVAALAAAWQANLLRKQMRDDARPYVIADIVPSLHGIGAWDLVLHSTGKTTAHDVAVTTDPAGWAPHDDDDHISEYLAIYLADKRDLPPGARHRLMWRYEERDETTNELKAVAGAPSVAKIKVTYQDEKGKATFDFSASFDLDVLAPITPAPADGPRKEGEERGRELMNIDRAIRTLSQHVGELRR